MALAIETFSNAHGGNALFKALTHPLAAEAVPALLRRLAGARRAVVYDPMGQAEAFAALYGTPEITAAFDQDVQRLGRSLYGRASEPVTRIAAAEPDLVFLPAFDAERLVGQILHLLPAGTEFATLDSLRIPEALLTRPRHYLDPLNFATNFAFFRDQDGLHARVVTVNYWSGYGGKGVRLWLALFDGTGRRVATWEEPLPDGAAAVTIDSREVRARFGLPAFAGQLFLHVVGAAGHDVVKYALDTFGEADAALSCTHDANAWPADLYAGLPAPAAGERVLLWIQNSLPIPVAAGEVALNPMGRPELSRPLDATIAPFASHPVDVAALLPDLAWPDQVEIRAGRHFVRPRYEVLGAGRRRIAHVNVERTDLQPDPRIPALSEHFGKGFILPAPVLPPDRYSSLALPTPMATGQAVLPVALAVYDPQGREIARRRLGPVPRDACPEVVVDALLDGQAVAFGHMELLYDFTGDADLGEDAGGNAGAADGWLHALFRYRHRTSSHAAETSFGAHLFNAALTYKGEPQSYAGRPPGLSTRLFLRLGHDGLDTLCHLIYPVSGTWHARSETRLLLHGGDGRLLAEEALAIPCGGSQLWHAADTFGRARLDAAGPGGYVVVRDTTCRLFGYHGLVGAEGAFSLDHMFGF